jgi:hypothetical protein
MNRILFFTIFVTQAVFSQVKNTEYIVLEDKKINILWCIIRGGCLL